MSRVLRDPGSDIMRERFVAAGNDLRTPGSLPPTAGPEYTALALDLLRPRPHALFLADRDGEVTARAAVVRSTGRPDAAMLGLYEARAGPVGDVGTAELLAEATEWCREVGLRRILAPVDGSTWMLYRFRIPDSRGEAGDGGRHFSWEPTHPPRYLERFREAGFRETLEYETLGLVFPSKGPYRLADAADQTRPTAEAAEAAGYRFHRLRDHRDALPWAELHALSSAAFAENPLFEPLPFEVFQALYGSALGGASLDFTHWIRDANGVLRAVMFAFREGHTVVVKSVAVDPAHRGRHLSTALVHRMLVAAVQAGVDEIISALVRTGNASEFLSRRHLMPGVKTWRHGYAVLEREVDG